MRKFFLTGLMVCFSFLLLNAQPSIKSTIDRNEILIGEQFKLTVEANFIADARRVRWLSVPDSLQHLEVVSRSKIDSIYTNSQLLGIAQTFTFTSFDSGKWVLPSFLIGIDPATDDTTYNYFTDSFPITVSFSASDTTSQLRDIKPVRQVEILNTMWYWIGGGVLLLLLIILLIWLYTRRKKKIVSPIPVRSNLSAYDEAMQELKNLQKYNFVDAGDIRIIHTKLGEILKRYLSRRENDNYLNKTTSDMLIILKQVGVNNETLGKAAATLRAGDAVKFAKYLPPTHENEASLQSMEELIKTIQLNPHTTP